MAFTILDMDKRVIGVVSLDSKKRFDDLGFDEEDFEELFMKLCGIIEKIFNS
jgi:hypothetical protein